MALTVTPWYLLQLSGLTGVAAAFTAMTALLARQRGTPAMSWFGLFSLLATVLLITNIGIYVGAPWGPSGAGVPMQGVLAVLLTGVYLQYQQAICDRPLPGFRLLMVANLALLVPALLHPGSLWYQQPPAWVSWNGPYGEALHRYANSGPTSSWYLVWSAAATAVAVWGVLSAWRSQATLVRSAVVIANTLIIASLGHDLLLDVSHKTSIYLSDYALLGAFLGQAMVLMVDERRTARAIQRRETYYRTVVESVPDGILILDGHRIRESNPQANHLLGVDREQVIGRPLEDFLIPEPPQQRTLPPGQEERALPQMLDHAYSGPPQRGRLRLRQRTGDAIIIDVAVCTLNIENERSSLVILHDATQQVRLEDQLRQGQKMEAIGQLAGGVAHDFNNMLTGILASGELLRKKVQDERLLRLVDTIILAGERAAILTQKLVGFARRRDVSMQPVSIHAEIELALDLLLRAHDPRIEVERRLEADSCLVVGNASDLQSAFLNLFINARDAMPQGGRLSVSTSINVLDQAAIIALAVHWPLAPGPFIQITITDTGTGMDENVLRRAFEPFFTTKKLGQGTGLGLAGVYGMIREHHGAVQVFSVPGRGTRFVLLLPLLTSPLPTSGPSKGSEGLVSGMPSVLLYGEDVLLRDSVSAMLSSLGCNVVIAQSAEETLSHFQQRRTTIDLVIFDQYLSAPGVVQLCRTIHRLTPGLRMVIMTNYSGDLALSSIREEGYLSTLLKPFTRKDLARLVSAGVAGAGASPAAGNAGGAGG